MNDVLEMTAVMPLRLKAFSRLKACKILHRRERLQDTWNFSSTIKNTWSVKTRFLLMDPQEISFKALLTSRKRGSFVTRSQKTINDQLFKRKCIKERIAQRKIVSALFWLQLKAYNSMLKVIANNCNSNSLIPLRSILGSNGAENKCSRVTFRLPPSSFSRKQADLRTIAVVSFSLMNGRVKLLQDSFLASYSMQLCTKQVLCVMSY